jgi:hypothetical protein
MNKQELVEMYKELYPDLEEEMIELLLDLTENQKEINPRKEKAFSAFRKPLDHDD